MLYGEGIIERLSRNSKLRDEDNPMREVIINTVGAWLDNHDWSDIFEGAYLQSAEGKYLDLHGKDLNVTRKLNEEDEDYYVRLVYETLGVLTVDYLINVFDLDLYCYIDDFNVSNNTLTSDNYYIKNTGFMVEASEEVKSILNKKFVLSGDLKWLTL